ncbi:hypothetical protein O59_000881 [Cellvibrio sp. BR]|jgi:hypothetical protein|nr:hypothetical protein O59_000881 [Cellvibrio sp. BR]
MRCQLAQIDLTNPYALLFSAPHSITQENEYPVIKKPEQSLASHGKQQQLIG